MNRVTGMRSSDTLIVVDRSNRRRNLIVAAVAIVAILLAAYFAFGRSSAGTQAAPGAGGGRSAGGQIPTVTVIVPGRSDVARTVTASGALAARRDQPVGVSGEGGRVAQVYVCLLYTSPSPRDS